MSDLKELYQEMILDHNRKPRNFRIPEGANRKAEGYNPLCGDKMTVYLNVEGDTVREIGFQGSGCAISRASTSMMTSTVKGKTRKEIEGLFEKFHKMVTGEPHAPASPELAELGKLTVFAGVCEFPARVKCASLAWHTLKAALDGAEGSVSTEEEVSDGSKE